MDDDNKPLHIKSHFPDDRTKQNIVGVDKDMFKVLENFVNMRKSVTLECA